MAEITVRDVSDDVVACLEAQAKANEQSLESEVRQILVRHARRSHVDDFREQTAKLCALTAGTHQTDSVELLREDRGDRLDEPNSVTRSNGLRHLAGTWSEAEYRQFDQAIAPLGKADEARR